VDDTTSSYQSREDAGAPTWQSPAISTAACALFGISGAATGAILDRPFLSLGFYVLAYLAGGWKATWEALRALR